MKKIKLGLGSPLRNSVEITIIDVTTGEETKRGVLTAEYTEWDVKPLIAKGMGLAEVVDDYEAWIYKTLRRHLLDEVEVVEGMEEFRKIVEDRVKDFY